VIVSTGPRLLDTPTLKGRLPRWDAAGCRSVAGFDDAVLWRLAVEGDWEEIGARLPTQRTRDDSGRSVAVRGAWYLRDGDWDGLMLAAGHHPEGAAAYLDLAYGVALQAPVAP
jgi:hypothetical protein